MMEQKIDFQKEYEIRKSQNLENLRLAYLDRFEDADDLFQMFVKNMDNAFKYRGEIFKYTDHLRSKDKKWYAKKNTYALDVYLDEKENTISGLCQHIDYFKDMDVKILNIIGLLKPTLVVQKQGDLPQFFTVDSRYGSVADLHRFIGLCHERNISVCFDNNAEFSKPENMDLLLADPLLFNKMVFDFLMFANLGVDIFKINTRPYKWTDFGVDFPYMGQGQHVVDLLRATFDMVAPGCIFLINGEYDPETPFTYTGSLVEQEGQLINNASSQDVVFHAIATKNVEKLRTMINSEINLGKVETFMNYIQDPWGDKWNNLSALCGLPYAKDRIEAELAISFDLMLQGYLLMLPGIPTMYLGDEVAYFGSKSLNWAYTEARFKTDSVQYHVSSTISYLKRVREVYPQFNEDAEVTAYDTFDPSVFGICRSYGGKHLIGLFNFSNTQKTAWIKESGNYTNLLNNDFFLDQSIVIKPYAMLWLYSDKPLSLG
ncbi:MAG: hypothetical protein K6C69_05620 [Lachnospiraceae bacterium]|nr:hypothetical protein [Lachnospiraceae bacterium]